MKITVIGESNIDITVLPQGGRQPGGCNPARISFHHGGVARNIAHNLSLLGHEVCLMTVFGGDDFAQRMMDECQSLGIDLSLSDHFKEEKSPIFLSFNDENGIMQSAVSDIKLNDRMGLDWVKGKTDEISRSEIIVADTLLSADALAWLIDHCAAPLYLDAVSPRRASRIAEALAKSERKTFHALKCNLIEAQALTNLKEPTSSARSLNDKGITKAYVTMGKEGAVFSSASATKRFHALPAQFVNAAGSGDAFFSGVIHGHAVGRTDEDAVAFGLELAKAALESDGPVPFHPPARNCRP